MAASNQTNQTAKGTPVALGDFSGSKTYTARGGPTTFDNNKYKVDSFSYPSDLMTALGEYGNNYVIFYINAQADSKLIKDGKVQVVQDLTPRDRGDLSAQANTITNSAQITDAAKSLGVPDTAAKTIGSSFNPQTRRLATAIALHTPNTMQTKYTMNYEEENLQIFGGIIAGTAALKKASEKKGGSNIAKDAANQGGAAAIAAGLSIPGTAGFSKLTGMAPNPRKEQIFKGVEFRTFTFDYQFYPRNQKEAANVERIIYQFKLHMHPEFKDAQNFLYIYPSEFDIFYYNGTQENQHVNRHTSCVLQDMSVDYSPQGQFTSFADGTPTQINISLTFKELATLTKEKIQDGL
jgi:hypothetical protein